MNTLLEYRQCEFEVGAYFHKHGKHEGKWSPTFTIWKTPNGASHVLSGENSEGPHPDTREEAEALANQQVKAWVDAQWAGCTLR